MSNDYLYTQVIALKSLCSINTLTLAIARQDLSWYGGFQPFWFNGHTKIESHGFLFFPAQDVFQLFILWSHKKIESSSVFLFPLKIDAPKCCSSNFFQIFHLFFRFRQFVFFWGIIWTVFPAFFAAENETEHTQRTLGTPRRSDQRILNAIALSVLFRRYFKNQCFLRFQTHSANSEKSGVSKSVTWAQIQSKNDV